MIEYPAVMDFRQAKRLWQMRAPMMIKVKDLLPSPMVSYNGVEYLAERHGATKMGGPYNYRMTPRSMFDLEPLGDPPTWQEAPASA